MSLNLTEIGDQQGDLGILQVSDFKPAGLVVHKDGVDCQAQGVSRIAGGVEQRSAQKFSKRG